MKHDLIVHIVHIEHLHMFVYMLYVTVTISSPLLYIYFFTFYCKLLVTCTGR